MPRSPPGGGISFGKKSGRTSYKRSTKTRRQRFLHEIILGHVEVCLRHRHCGALVGCGYRGRLVDLLNVCRIRGAMGHARDGCFLNRRTVRVNYPESDVVLDLAPLEHWGKRRLIVVQRPVRVKTGHPAPIGSGRSSPGKDHGQ